jgi:hypothetical protein
MPQVTGRTSARTHTCRYFGLPSLRKRVVLRGSGSRTPGASSPLAGVFSWFKVGKGFVLDCVTLSEWRVAMWYNVGKADI